MMGVFGLDALADTGAVARSASGGASAEELAATLSAFRDGVRSQAIAAVKAGKKGGAAGGAEGEAMLRLCDATMGSEVPRRAHPPTPGSRCGRRCRRPSS